MNKKLLFVIENLGEGGAERVMSILANELSLRGYDTSIALLQADAKVVYPISENISIFRLGQREIAVQERQPLIRFAKKLKSIKIIQYERRRALRKQIDKSRTIPLKAFLKKNHFDVVISFLVRPNIATIRATKNMPNRVIISERNYPLREDYPLALMQIKNAAYKSKYDCCVAQTKDILKMLGDHVAKRGVIIENPVNEMLPVTSGNKREHIITNYCSFKQQKNLPLLINAFAEFIKDHKDYRLEIYGNGDRTELDRLVERLHLGNSVSILPFCSDIHNRIKNYSMFVSTSNFEGISNSMIEAMAVGVPTISTDCDGGGAREVIRDHKNGLLIPKEDKERLVAAMKEIADNPELAEQLSVNGRKIREEYSKDRILSKWIELIEMH